MNNRIARQAADDRRVANLELARLRKQFGDVVAIDDVSLTVQAGEFLTLLGASGSGKSTTLMAVAGFVQPTSGQVLINGVDQTRNPPYKRDIGLVFQHYALFPHLTVEKNVAFPLEMRRVGKAETAQRVGRALDLVRLGGFGGRKPSELSGGQQQRVALARALVYEPSILLLDEPLGALDKNLREEMQYEIRRIQQSLGITTISVTHDQQEAITMSDRIAIMRGGRIEQVGTPAEIYERPATRFVAEFMGSSNFLRGRIEAGTGGGLQLRTEAGPVVGLAEGVQAAAGARADLVIRPERLACTAGAQADGHALQATATQIVYVGETWRVSLALASGEHIVASLANRGPLPFAEGERVSVELGGQAQWAVPAGA